MRQLWAAARGRIDMELMTPLFVLGCFGQQVSERQLAKLHPLRRLEMAQEEKSADGDAGWVVLGAALKTLNQERGK
jgi:hypothetical protein